MRYKVISKQYNDIFCFICGLGNKSGVQAEFFNCVDEHGENCLVTRIEPKSIHQSFPDRMHGGVVSAILDEAIGRAVQFEHPEIWAVTIDLNVKFRNPAPIDKTIYVVSKITNIANRTFDGEGKMFLSDKKMSGSSVTLVATATARYFRVTLDGMLENIKDPKFKKLFTDQDRNPTTKNLPTHIDI